MGAKTDSRCTHRVPAPRGEDFGVGAKQGKGHADDGQAYPFICSEDKIGPVLLVLLPCEVRSDCAVLETEGLGVTRFTGEGGAWGKKKEPR